MRGPCCVWEMSRPQLAWRWTLGFSGSLNQDRKVRPYPGGHWMPCWRVWSWLYWARKKHEGFWAGALPDQNCILDRYPWPPPYLHRHPRPHPESHSDNYTSHPQERDPSKWTREAHDLKTPGTAQRRLKCQNYRDLWKYLKPSGKPVTYDTKENQNTIRLLKSDTGG